MCFSCKMYLFSFLKYCCIGLIPSCGCPNLLSVQPKSLEWSLSFWDCKELCQEHSRTVSECFHWAENVRSWDGPHWAPPCSLMADELQHCLLLPGGGVGDQLPAWKGSWSAPPASTGTVVVDGKLTTHSAPVSQVGPGTCGFLLVSGWSKGHTVKKFSCC